MNRLTHSLAVLLLAASPTLAEEAPDTSEGFDLLGEGARIILRSLLDGVEPTLEEMQQDLAEAMAAMGPAMTRLMEMMDDVRNYEPPEVLPNGDIIIRRKPGTEVAPLPPKSDIET